MNSMRSNILATQNLSIGYNKGKKIEKTIASNLNLKLHAGEFVCLLGANGSGKSTLMRTVASVQPALAGRVLLENTPLQKLKTAHVARKLSLVLTDKITIGNLSVYALVSLGRMPYTGWMGKLTNKDKEIVEWALNETETTGFIHRNIDQLSDGERQKVMIARALAQDTSLILLDEPTAHLDLPNRVMIFKLLRKLARQTNKAILLTTHELDLALQAADKIWLMEKRSQQGQSNIVTGTPEDLVLSETFEKAFEKEGFHFDKQTGAFKINEPERKKIYMTGEGIQAFWTKRALEREGFAVTQNKDATYKLTLEGNNKENYRWTIDSETFESVENLLEALRQKEKQTVTQTN